MCRSLKPQVEAFEKGFRRELRFYELKAPYDRELLIKLNVSGFPTFLFYGNGQQLGCLGGAGTRVEEIQEQIQMLLKRK